MYSFPDKNVITSSDKFFFTCPSYGFISAILSIIEEIISKQPEINIIVMDEQMRLFWHQLISNKSLNWNIIYLDTAPPGRYRNVLSWLKIRPTVRRLFEGNFKSVRNAYFYCCGHATNFILFSLVKMIAKKNTVVFLNILYPVTRKLYSLKALILLIHTRVFYGIDVTARYFAYDNEPLIYLSESFFKKLNIQLHEFKYQYNARLLQKYNPIPACYTSGKKIVWLDDDCSVYDKRMQDQIVNCFKSIKNIVDKYFTINEVIYKAHPNPYFQSKNSTWLYGDYEELPAFMNADFIISNPNIEFIIGGNSALLSTAASNTNIMTISYLKLMPFEDQEIKRSMVEFWMGIADQKILYVNSLEELDFLFKSREKAVQPSQNNRLRTQIVADAPIKNNWKEHD